MTDEQVSGEFRFDVTGNGLKKLADLDALLKSVNSIGLVATKSVAKMTAALKAEEAAVWKASAAYRSYTTSINKAVKAHNDLRKAAGTGAVSPTTTARTVKSPLDQASAIVDREAEKVARETARRQEKIAQEASAFLAGEDAKRAASAKASAKAQERAYREAAREAIIEAQMITKAQVAQEAATERARVRALREQEAYLGKLSNTRYALYDVSRTAMRASIALGAVYLAPTIMAARFERSFASVARTVGIVGDAASELRDQFEDLSTSIPQSFDSLAQIGTLAGQLDIPAQSVAKFTETVAQFSATTNVGVEEAATNLGRVAQLTGTASDQYANLGSSIYQVGVTSVATESEILDMASQIATAGDLAGLTNTQIIALSGALASLGVQPEAARGSLQRIFNIIENGATSSTRATEKLAETTGMTIQQMQDLWKQGDDGSQEVFSAFVAGLERMQAAGENTTDFLKSMGINAVRDQRLLQVLANNTEVYTQALNNASSAYVDGTTLANAYNKQTDNVADNFTRLINTMTAFIAELGDSGGVLNTVLKTLNLMGQAWLDFTRIPVLGWVLKATVGLSGMAAVITLSMAAMAQMRGAMYGLVTAATGVQGINASLTASFGALSKELATTVRMYVAGTLTGRSFQAAMASVGDQTVKTTAAQAAYNASTATGAVASSGMARQVLAMGGSMLKSVAILAAITAGVAALSWEYERFTEGAKGRANNLFGTDDTALVQAMADDTAALAKGEKAYRTFTATQATSAKAVPEWQQALDAAAAGQDNLGTSVETTTDKIRTQTVAIGRNTQTAIAQMLAGSDQIKQAWMTYGEALTQNGFNLNDYVKQLAVNADDAITILTKKAAEAEEKLRQAQANPNASGTGEVAYWTKVAEGYNQMIKAAEGVKTKVDEAVLSQQLFDAVLGKSTQAALQTKDAFAALGDETEGLGTDGTALSSAWTSVKDGLTAPYQMADSWEKLGEAIGKNGKAFDGLGAKARDNVSAVIDVLDQMQNAAGDNSAQFGTDVLGMMVSLQKQGIYTGDSLSFLGKILQSTLGGSYKLDFNSSEAQANILGVIDSAIAAQRSIMALQATAIATASIAVAMGNVAQLGALQAAQAKYAAASDAVKSLEALRASALAASAAAQKRLNAGIKQGTEALRKNSGASKQNTAAHKKEARTLSDWVSELEQVMNAADNFRWGMQDAWRAVEKAQRDASVALVETVWNIEAAYDKFFSAQDYRDSITSLFYDVQEQAQDAADAVVEAANKIKDAQAELAGISSDKANLTYGLNVAIMYGDNLRADAIRAKLAELDAKQADTTLDLAKAQRDLQAAYDSQDKSLTGNTKQSIANRKIVQDLLGTYADYVKKLADGGASTEEIADAVAQAQADFMAQGTAMGFAASELTAYSQLFTSFASSTTTTSADANEAVRKLYDSWQAYILKLVESGASQKEINRAIADGKAAVTALAQQMGLSQAEIKKYGDAFDGMIKIIAKIPKNVTVNVDADTDAATRAIKEFIAKNTGGKGASGGISVPVDVAYGGGKSKDREHAEDMMDKYAKLIMGTSNMAALTEYSKKWTYWQRQSLKSLWTGGFTGRGNKYDEAGVVHKGEYVIPKQDVNQSTGLPYIMERANNISTTNNYAKMPSVIMVELSPTDRSLLAASGGTVVVQLDGRELATAVGKANSNSSVRGDG